MALYNVPFADPEHAIKAVRTGLEFQERTLAVSQRWEAKLGVTIRNGVGINTVEAVVGTPGSRQRLEYTAIGDTINSARAWIDPPRTTRPLVLAIHLEHGRTIREKEPATLVRQDEAVKIYAVADPTSQAPRAILNRRPRSRWPRRRASGSSRVTSRCAWR